MLEAIPMEDSSAKSADLKGGEKLISIQGKQVNTIEKLSEIYDNIPEGKTAELEFERDGKAVDIKFVKKTPETKSVSLP